MLLSPQTQIPGPVLAQEAGRPLHVVLAVNSFLPHIGGKEMVVHYLAKSLSTMGHHVRVFVRGGFWRYRGIEFPYPVHRWPGLGRLLRDRTGEAALRWESALWKTDVIHAHVTYPSGYWAVQLAQKTGIPVVITPHGDDIHTIPEIGHGKRLDPAYSSKIEFAVRKAARLTAISASIENSLREAGAPGERICRIPNGIDLERFQGAAVTDIRHRFGLPSSAKLILSVGSYIPRRGFEYLVQAIRLVQDTSPDAYLVIAGRNTEPLVPLVKELGLEARVLLLGQIRPPSGGNDTTDLLADIYKSADVYVSSGMSEGSEGLSLALLDAMAAGLPVVATEISGNRDVVRNGESGYLVPARNVEAMAAAMTRVLTDPGLAMRFREKSRSVAQDYSWDNAARQYLALYSELVS